MPGLRILFTVHIAAVIFCWTPEALVAYIVNFKTKHPSDSSCMGQAINLINDAKKIKSITTRRFMVNDYKNAVKLP